MLLCPMCKKRLAEHSRECPRCRADLSILVDYVSHLETGLERADGLTRQGELGEAVWAYLEVLEVDPDNAAARRQINRVALAVRQFDRAPAGRRWLERLRRQARFRHWLASWDGDESGTTWLNILLVVFLALLCLATGYALGRRAALDNADAVPAGSLAGPE